MRILASLLLCLAAATGFAQTVPNGTITQGQIWTPAQWNLAFQYKADVNNGILYNPTLNGTITTAITGSTQCLHVSAAGVMTGTGADCGSGGGGGSTSFSALTGGTNNSGAAMLVGSTSSLGPFGTGTITATSLTSYSGAPPIPGGYVLANGSATSVPPQGNPVNGGMILNSGGLTSQTPVNAQTGTGYTINVSDLGKLVTLSNASSVGVSLPQPVSLGVFPSFFPGYYFYIQNKGVGTVTITPTSSTINGAATLALTTNQGCQVVSDGTNWQVASCTAVSPGGGGGLSPIANQTVLGNGSGSTATPVALTLGTNLVATAAAINTTRPINTQSGTTYAIATTDAGKLIQRSNASSCADTLPVATTAGYTAWFAFDYQNKGTAACTITPTTSTINGASVLNIAANTGCTITSDGTNYQVDACTALGISGSGTVTTTGSPANGNLTKFSGATSITNGDLSGDCTTSGTLAIVCTETNGTAFGTFATQNYTTPPVIGGTTPNAVSTTSLTVIGPATFSQGTSGSYPSWTTNGILLNAGAATVNDNSSAGTIGEIAVYGIGIPTVTRTTAGNVTYLDTLFVQAPVAGAGVTTAGANLNAAHFQGNILVTGVISTNSGGNIVSSGNVIVGAGGTLAFSGGAIFSSPGVSVLQVGSANSATPASGTIQNQGSRGGTDSNVGGGNLTIAAGDGTGTGTPATLIFKTPHLAASGTTQQTMNTQLTLGDNVITIASGSTVSINSLLISTAAPTISSGFGTGPSVTHNNGSASFSINVGTGGTATSGVVALNATAADGWSCSASDPGTTPTGQTEVSSASTTTVTVTNYSRTVGTALAWTASEIIQVSCFAN